MNTTPNLYYHYNKSDGTFPVAIAVLENLLAVLSNPRASWSTSEDHWAETDWSRGRIATRTGL